MASEVNEWYKGRSVLVTGALGLMGKVLIEKLLYSVPDVGCVYALVRSKRGKAPETRIEEMWKLPVSKAMLMYLDDAIEVGSGFFVVYYVHFIVRWIICYEGFEIP